MRPKVPDENGNPTFFDKLEQSLYNPYTSLAKRLLPKDLHDSYLGAAVFGITGALDLPSEAVLGGIRSGVTAGKQALESAKQGDVMTGTLQGLNAVSSPVVGAMAGTAGLPIVAASKVAEKIPGVAPVAQAVMSPSAAYLKSKQEQGLEVTPADRAAGQLADLAWNAVMFRKMGQITEGMKAHSIQTPDGPRVVAIPELYQEQNPLDRRMSKEAEDSHVAKNYKEFDPDLTRNIKAVAFKVGDRIIPGEPKDVHALLYDRLPQEDRDAIQYQYAKVGEANSAGFVTQDGRFFTKYQLLTMQKELAAREEALPKFASSDHVFDYSKEMTFDKYVDITRRLRNNEELMQRKLSETKDPKERQNIMRTYGYVIQLDREAMSFYNQRHSLRNMGYTPEELNFDSGIAFDRFYKERAHIRSKVSDQIKTAMPNLKPEQVDSYMFMNDEFAHHWSKWTGRPAVEWYLNRFGEGGGFRAGESAGGLKQGANAPTFYSGLQRSIEEKMPERAGPLQVRNIAYQYAKKDEIKWTGLDEFLDSKKGQPVTKQEVLDHLRNNAVQVHEVMKGTDSKKVGYDPTQDDWNGMDEDWYGSGDFPDIKLGTGDYRAVDAEGNNFVYIYQRNDGKWVFQHPNDAKDVFNTREEVDRFANSVFNREEGFAQYQDYSVPGGKNYRELLLTLPEKGAINTKENFAKAMRGEDPTEQDYQSPHWQEPNVIAHVRMQDFTDAQGKRVLFLEELQSDWHQQGRKEGYRTLEKDRIGKLPVGWVVKPEPTSIAGSRWQLFNETGEKVDDFPVFNHPDNLEGATKEAIARINMFNESGPPQGPFSKSWHEMALRRMLRYAAENGYDKVAWTPGAWQDARWEGADAEEGMKGFYDKMVPDYLNKYGKKWGAKVGETVLKTGTNLPQKRDWKREGSDKLTGYSIQVDENNYAHGYKTKEAARTVPSIDVTPAMKKSVMEEGQPLFQSSSSRANEYLKRVTENARRAIKVGNEVVIAQPGMKTHSDIVESHPTARKLASESMAKFQEILGRQETEVSDASLKELKEYREKHKNDIVEGYVRPDGSFVSKEDIEQTYRDLSGKEGFRLYQKRSGMSPEEFDRLMGGEAKGSVHFKDQKAIITAFSKADFSTLVHETAHVYRRDLPPELLAEAEKYVGVKDGKWEVEHEEKFARSFEKYLRDGQAPTPLLKQVFEDFKKWLMDIYVHVSGSALDVDVHPNIKKVFDQMLGGPETVPVQKTRVIPRSTGTYGRPQ